MDKNILQLPEHVKVDDYVGHYKIIDGVAQVSSADVCSRMLTDDGEHTSAEDTWATLTYARVC